MKKVITLLLCGLMMNLFVPFNIVQASENCDCVSVEHLKLPKKLAKKTPTNIVNSTATEADITAYNTIQVAFAQNFNSKYAKVGDELVFVLPETLSTVEGTQILPASTKIVAEICDVIRPKSFNRSGKVYLNFKYIELPDGEQIDLDAKLFNKKDFLSRGKLNAWGKGFGSTFGGSAVGVAAGCGIGIAANAVIIGGFAIGLPIGFAVGAIAGLTTPGLYYKAKAGDKINIQLLDNVTVEK